MFIVPGRHAVVVSGRFAFSFDSGDEIEQQGDGFVVAFCDFQLLDLLNIFGVMHAGHGTRLPDPVALGEKRGVEAAAESPEFIGLVVLEFL